MEALTSIPEEPSVAYCGKGFADVFTILILTDGIAAKIK